MMLMGWVCIQCSTDQQNGLIARWTYRQDMGREREAWTIEEEHALINAHRDGNRWAEIAKVLPRTNRVLLLVLRFFSPIAKVRGNKTKWIIGVTRYTKSSVI
ncbi:unnamed protein product [Triticum turgidum subsp. durum]|uniref:Myb-like domain-containing protein n=1 Tax=Triticum turgidum subsp. durum TaxID=4567 RepID=A0A9R0QQV4_TRITD|nr:unnamed protein product [Triticum turgidum subsp. durum]